jgi:hypothetical protein
MNRQRVKAWQVSHPDRARERNKLWRAKNAAANLGCKRRSRLKHLESVRAKARVRAAATRQAKPHLKRMYEAMRRARKSNATPTWVDTKAIGEIYGDCPAGMQVDHVVPLCGVDVCGLHVPWNLQYLTPSENASKRNRLVAQ